MKLNFGCGSIQPDGWVNIDNDPEFNTVFREIYSQDDNTFDLIVAHCSIQMIEYNNITQVLAELHRVLKPEGILRISLPDIKTGFRKYIDQDIDWFPNGEDSLHDRFCAWLTWYSTTKSLLTQDALSEKLHQSGFENVAWVGFQETFFGDKSVWELDTRNGECYFMEAQKNG